jgi:hypothetical protein
MGLRARGGTLSGLSTLAPLSTLEASKFGSFAGVSGVSNGEIKMLKPSFLEHLDLARSLAVLLGFLGFRNQGAQTREFSPARAPAREGRQ